MAKKIKSMGGSAYILVDKVMSAISGLRIGDDLDIKCSKGKIVITKSQEENNKGE
jgi:antitoxin component of MazEF toxin-antitoxin module